jgi:hypothetical protein
MAILSNFGYKDAKGQIVKVPVRYGDMSRQVGHILKKNSENTVPSAPFIAGYIKDLQYDRLRMQDPTFISKVNIRERAFDKDGNAYLTEQGANYTVERIMPTPYEITFNADIWTTNTDQKLQLWEQLVVLFNPSLELQTTDNYLDWTSLSVLTLDSQVWNSRSVPQGLEQDIEITTLTFKAPIWITPPAKLKKLGIITKIITNVFAVSQGAILNDFSTTGAVDMFGTPDTTVIVTPGDFELLVLNNNAVLIKNEGTGNSIDTSLPENVNSWRELLDLYPGKFTAGISQLRLTKPDGNEIVAYISLDPMDETKMVLNFDTDTIPSNTIINGRGSVNAVINPETFNPKFPVNGTRYLILGSININPHYSMPDFSGPVAWKNANSTDFQANENDIIEWNGAEWIVIFNSNSTNAVTYITNTYTGIQYKWASSAWSKSFEGIYAKDVWRLIL